MAWQSVEATLQSIWMTWESIETTLRAIDAKENWVRLVLSASDHAAFASG
jgi:hypothetical protein